MGIINHHNIALGIQMYRPTLEEARKIAAGGEYRTVPVYREIYSDSRTPIEVLRALLRVSLHCYMLESMEDSQRRGRYTILGFEPTMEFTCVDGTMVIKTEKGVVTEEGLPDEYIRRIVEENRSPRLEELPMFTGGLVGYFSYDFVKYREPTLKLDADDQEHFKDVDLMLFDKVIVFDNLRQKIMLIANASTSDLDREYRRVSGEIDRMAELVLHGEPAVHTIGKLTSGFRPLFEKGQFCSMVDRVKRHIVEGDVFQVVLSNRLEADYEGSLFDVYRVLRTSNPSPYMFYFSGCDVEIAGASPETLVKLENGTLHTFPLAGTRPRGDTPEEDERLEAELLSDEKELAEHNMLVDLGRNDLGKICRFGSVRVDRYLSVERFSHVMHIGSTVSGMMDEGRDAVDAIDAILPAGTLSGAPKLRACEIINQLENNKRGIYGGAIGYLGFNGDMDVCIAIRIAFRKNGKVFVRSGAGIVADSVPENEYEECMNKAKAVIVAIETADGGVDP